MAARYWKIAAEECREELKHEMNSSRELSALTSSETQKLTDQLRVAGALKMSEEDKRNIGQAALLFEYAGVADALGVKLEDVWHQWDAAGEKPFHPLGAAIMLSNELRQFKVLYRYHLDVLKATFPESISNTTTGGFPSNGQYPTVRRDLLNHAGLLRDRADAFGGARAIPDR